MAREKFTVWKIAKNGNYSHLVKEFETRNGARRRADAEAEDEWRPGVRYVVTTAFAAGRLAEDEPASAVGLDGIEYTGSPEYEVEVTA